MTCQGCTVCKAITDAALEMRRAERAREHLAASGGRWWQLYQATQAADLARQKLRKLCDALAATLNRRALT